MTDWFSPAQVSDYCDALERGERPIFATGRRTGRKAFRRAVVREMATRGPLVPVEVVCLMEVTLRDGQAEHGDRWRTKSVAHHVGKGISHAIRGLGPTPIDVDSGRPHLVLAATRLVLAVAVMLDRERDR